MIIYNKAWLANLLIRDEVKKASRSGAISAKELRKVEEKYPVGFYTPNIFIRIGLFILTGVITAFSGGLITLMLSDAHIIDTWGYFLFLGSITYIALEIIVRNNHHFKSGVDDALMWISGGLFVTAFILFLNSINNEPSLILIFGFGFLLALYYSFRFADRLMTATGLLSFIAFVFFTWKDLSSWGMATMPFLMIALSAAIYCSSKLSTGKTLAIHYTGCLAIVQIISLLILYLAGNYYAVQTLGGVVPFVPFFWTWTILLPFIYLYFGIRQKDVILLRTGLLVVAGAAFTFRNYYHVMPVEGALSIIGAILLSISYGVIKYLKVPKHGFTYEDLDEDNLMDKIKIESLIVSETFSDTSVQSEGTSFGGGDFGGGGASSNF